MAINWIKMRVDLLTHPKVVRIASALDADTLRVVGGLMSVWCLFDAHTEDGRLEGYTVKSIDDYLRWPGFAEAMVAVGWIEFDDASAMLPRFCNHNGQSAKRRAQEAERKQLVRKTSARNADKEQDKVRTREEKRREDINTSLSQSEPELETVANPKDALGSPALVSIPLALNTPEFTDFWRDTWLPHCKHHNRLGRWPSFETQKEQLVQLIPDGPHGAIETLRKMIQREKTAIFRDEPKAVKAKSTFDPRQSFGRGVK